MFGKTKVKVKNIQNSKFYWAWVDALQGKAELIPIRDIFQVCRRQKLPFLPQTKNDFDSSAKYIQILKCSSTCEIEHVHRKYRTIFIKLLAGESLMFLQI